LVAANEGELSWAGEGPPVLRALPFSAIPGWADDNHQHAFSTFQASASIAAETPPKTRGLRVDGRSLQRAARLASQAGELGPDAARTFFERHFRPHEIAADGFVTGYYEPELAASRERTSRFTVPLYRRPDDLTEVSDANRPAGWDPDIRFARRTKRGVEPYPDRAAIEAGALQGRGLELAWLENPVDVFFVHVQGSARLKLTDGSTMRITFAGKSGHPYTSIGRLAVERGILSRDDAHKDGLEAWLKSHPSEARTLMRENRSFIFFQEMQLAAGDGTMGAAGVPLTPGRSLAVDRALHTFHVPVWVDAPGLADPDRRGRSFRRLMIAQDTGSAIVGPARGDLFFGSGARAGSLAGRVRHRATMVVLVPVPDHGAG
jgi:membrane-bound lytic murein transglycosylase A